MEETLNERQRPNYSLTESREEGMHEDPLPRAVTRHNAFTLLDGEWKFAPDAENEGLSAAWYVVHEYTGKAQWPGSVEEHMLGHSWHDKVIAWYEREFTVPATGKNFAGGTLLQLTFGACGYETMVWLNGHLLRTIEGEEMHTGEYTSFSYELDEALLQPVNRLTVRIADSMDADLPRGKQESTVYKRGGIWYQTYTGSVRSIWLETVERNRLRSRVGVVSKAEDDLVRFNLTTRIHDPGLYTIRLSVYGDGPQENAVPVATDEYSLLLEAGQKNQRLVLHIPGAKLWGPGAPHLYRLVAALVNADGYAAVIETRFGIRKIETRGSTVFLNNQPVYLDGILYQPGVATYEQIRAHIYAMKAIGCNLIRIHIAGVDPRIYRLADKLGMLLWVEVPSPHRSTEKSRANHRDELLRMLALIATHPSVVIWSLYNESWGAQDIASSRQARQYIMNMYHYLHIAFPQFLVVDNDGWQHISYEGQLKSDLLTAHLYTPDIQRWRTLLDQLIAGVQTGVTAFPLVVGDPYFFRKQVPLIVSEWGGFGFADYGGPQSDAERAAQIRLFKKELRTRPIAGDVYTQATNIEEERNGLIDFNTGSFIVPEGLLDSSAYDPQEND